MGNMKTFIFFAYEQWGGLKPEMAWDKKGRCFIPILFGFWVRNPFLNRKGGRK